MGIMKELGQAVDEMGWLLPTDIQNEAIPLILGGGDVLLVCFSPFRSVANVFFGHYRPQKRVVARRALSACQWCKSYGKR